MSNQPQQPPREPGTQAATEPVAAGQTKPELKQLEQPSGESSKTKVVTLVLTSSVLCALLGGFLGNRLEHSKATIELKKEDRKARISLYVALEDRVRNFEDKLANVIGVVRLAPALPGDRNAAEKYLEAAFDRLGQVMIEIGPMLNDQRIDASIRAQIQDLMSESTPKIWEAQETRASVALEQLYDGKLKQSFHNLQSKIDQEKSNLLEQPL